MKKIIILFSFFIGYFIYGVFITQYEPGIYPLNIKAENPYGYFDYRGAVHVLPSSTLEDAQIDDAVRAAQDEGLNFIIISDQNKFEDEPSFQGYYQNLLVLEADKYSYLDSRLIVYSRKDKKKFDSLGEVQVFLTDYLSQNNSNEDRLLLWSQPNSGGPDLTEPYPMGIDGIELLNLKSLWQEAWAKNKLSCIWSTVIYPFNPRLAFLRLFEEPEKEISLWDKLSQKRHTIATTGNDSSAKPLPFSKDSIRFPSYHWAYDIVSEHLLLSSELTGNLDSDKTKIFKAIKKGNFYLSVDILENPKGFNAYIDKGAGEILLMGSDVKYNKNLTLFVELPKEPRTPYEIIILRNGERYETFNSPRGRLPLREPGVYRVVVRLIPTLPLPDGKKWIPWIYTNPFYVN